MESAYGWCMDALRERMESAWTLTGLGHGCLYGNGWSLRARSHGWHMDALWEWMEPAWTLIGLGHGCSVGTNGVCVHINMVGTWMLCWNEWSLCAH